MTLLALRRIKFIESIYFASDWVLSLQSVCVATGDYLSNVFVKIPVCRGLMIPKRKIEAAVISTRHVTPILHAQKAVERFIHSLLMIGLYLAVFQPRFNSSTDQNVWIAFKTVLRVSTLLLPCPNNIF